MEVILNSVCVFTRKESESRSVVSSSLWLQAFSRGSSQPRDRTQVSHIAGGFFTSWATGFWIFYGKAHINFQWDNVVKNNIYLIELNIRFWN